MNTRTAVALLPILLAGCATSSPSPGLAPGAPGYVAPSNRTLVAEVLPSFESQEIYIDNNSTAPVIVTSVTVTDCVNVTPCGLIPLQIRVDPHQQRKVASLRAVDSGEAYSYNYRWTWSGAPAH